MGNMLNVCDKLCIGGSSAADGIDFIGRANIWISNDYGKSEINLAKYIIYDAIMKTAPGQLSVIGYDSDLSGIFAPFSALSSGGNKILDLIQDEEELKRYLQYIKQNIQTVQNVIQGREQSLIDFRRKTDRAVEGYTLVVLSLDMGMISQDIRSKIAMLMRSGPAYGFSFLIISTTYMFIQTSGGKDIQLSVESIAPNITVLEASGNEITCSPSGKNVHFSPISAERIISGCEKYLGAIRNAALPVVRFEELHDMRDQWSKSSIEGLTFSVGKWGINDVRITIGDEVNQRHNALITGAVGQGKSNLISVIIHSLCLHYSPKELRLYLLDFKEGVTFKAFSNIGKDDYLPHAQALGLESDPQFGMAVLDSLYQEYQNRMKLLKKHNLKSIREFRNRFPDAELPRIVVVIDEFQMMFGDDMQTGQKIVEMLEKSVRLFRAAGIHFILASQTIGGNLVLAQKRDSIFGQIPIRIALKNSLNESQQTLALNNSAAAFLRPREAIVNLDYGEPSQNKKCVIAFADEEVLVPIRIKWWEKGKSRYSAPYVFEGEKRISVSDCADAIVKRRNSKAVPAGCIGERISINGKPVMLPLSNEPGRNIAIIGAPDEEFNQAVGIMQGVAISLAVQHVSGDARFLFCDFSGDGPYDAAYPHFSRLLENSGYFMENIAPEEFESTVKELNENEYSGENIYLFGSGMDKWNYEPDPFGQGTVLKTLVEKGPSKGIHFIGWWVKSSAYTAQVSGFGGSDAFNSKIFLRVDERTVQSMTSPFVRWKSQSNRGLISDSVEFEEEMTFIPFIPVGSEDVSAFKSEIY